MILSFSTKINGKPTYFPEKIMKCLTLEYPDKFPGGVSSWLPSASPYWQPDLQILKTCKPKKHTIRIDSHNRWFRCRKIHFTIFPRSSRMYNFIGNSMYNFIGDRNEMKCISTQDIEIIHSKFHGDRGYDKGIWIKVDDVIISEFWANELAINDGFDSLYDFYQWFNTDFKGKIIHWTNLNY